MAAPKAKATKPRFLPGTSVSDNCGITALVDVHGVFWRIDPHSGAICPMRVEKAPVPKAPREKR